MMSMAVLGLQGSLAGDNPVPDAACGVRTNGSVGEKRKVYDK